MFTLEKHLSIFAPFPNQQAKAPDVVLSATYFEVIVPPITETFEIVVLSQSPTTADA